MGVADLFKGGPLKSVAIGLGVIALAPRVLPVVGRAMRPLGRAGMKSGVLLYEKGRETVVGLGGVGQDLVTELRSGAGQNQQRQPSEQAAASDEQTAIALAMKEAAAEVEAEEAKNEPARSPPEAGR